MNNRVLHHPKPQRPIHPLPTTSPPPNLASTNSLQDSSSYQRFSSPPVQQQGQPSYPNPPAHYQPHSPQQQPSYQSPSPQFFTPAAQSSYQQQPTWINPSPLNQRIPASNDDMYGSFGLNDATTQMGVQFGKHAFSAGSAYLDQNFTKYLPLPLSKLKHSFNVSNYYVLVKLKLLLFPWTHKGWARQLDRSDVSGMVQGYKPPRDDINCPDLYIPGQSRPFNFLVYAYAMA